MAKSIQSQMALGMIETRGLVASIEAADAMVKAASVTIVGQTKNGGGLISITGFLVVDCATASVNSSKPELILQTFRTKRF